MTADTDVITAAVELACRAPSLHNSQPWRWVAGDTSVDLFVDPRRTVTSTELAGSREMIRDLTTDHTAIPQVLVRVGVVPEGELLRTDAAATPEPTSCRSDARAELKWPLTPVIGYC